MPLHASVYASIEGQYSKATAKSEADYRLPSSDPIVYANGTGSGKADIAWDDERTLATGATENLDFAGAIADAFGTNIAAAKIKALQIESDAANTTALTIGNVTNGAQLFFGASAHTLVLQPGERFVIAGPVGWTITAATGDLVKVANASGASAKYRVKVIAASA